MGRRRYLRADSEADEGADYHVGEDAISSSRSRIFTFNSEFLLSIISGLVLLTLTRYELRYIRR